MDHLYNKILNLIQDVWQYKFEMSKPNRYK